jgi:Flp pilus assembly protein TadG
MIKMARLSRLATATGGASGIEFALVATFLVLPLTLGLYDFGTAVYDWMEVGNAARAGAQYVNVNGYSSAYTTIGNSCPATPTNTFTCAINAATNLGANVTVLVPANVTVSGVSVANPYCGCQNGATFTLQTAPDRPCTPCTSGSTSVTLAEVDATYNYKPIFNYIGFGPANGIPLSAQSTSLLY